MEEYLIISGTDGKYSVSNQGRVRNNITGKVLKPYRSYNGYLRVGLFLNGSIHNKRVHRLVAEAFLPKENNMLYVNHLDEDKTNNNVINLEWCDSKSNNNHGTRNERIKRSLSKKVAQYSNRGDLIRVYDSLKKASESIGTNDKGSNISKVCRGKMKSYKGYKWRYVI